MRSKRCRHTHPPTDIPGKSSVGFEVDHVVAVETRHEQSAEGSEGQVLGTAQRRMLRPHAEISASASIEARNGMGHKVGHIQQTVWPERNPLRTAQCGRIAKRTVKARRRGVEHQDLVRTKTGYKYKIVLKRDAPRAIEETALETSSKGIAGTY